MNENEKNINGEEEEVSIFTLTDEETGKEEDFELLAEATIDEKRYFALAPVDEEAIPAPFRGLPIALLTAGMIVLALMALQFKF